MTKNNLRRKSENIYGRLHREHSFEQYKVYLLSAEKISNRRQSVNAFFVTVHLLVISALSFFLIDIDASKMSIAVSAIGIYLCYLWWVSIRSYKQINSGKFKIIHEMERELPLAPFTHEWDVLGKGKDKSKYYPSSHIEMWSPCAFSLLYGLIIIRAVVSLFG